MSNVGTGDIITINVGGVLYTSSKSTLRKAPYFEALLQHTSDESPIHIESTRDSEGNLFFDRDGILFAGVLKFLRTGRVPQDEETVANVALDDELLFFGLEPPPAVFTEVLMVQWDSPSAQYQVKSISGMSQTSVTGIASTEIVLDLVLRLKGSLTVQEYRDGLGPLGPETIGITPIPYVLSPPLQIRQLTAAQSMIIIDLAERHLLGAFLHILEVEVGALGFMPECAAESGGASGLMHKRYIRHSNPSQDRYAGASTRGSAIGYRRGSEPSAAGKGGQGSGGKGRHGHAGRG